MRPILALLCLLACAGAARAQDIDLVLFGSCNDQTRPQAIFDVMAAQQPDLVLMLGDNVYGDVEGTSIAPLDDAYAALEASQPFARLRAAAPMLAAWDDHDYGVNDGGADFPLKRVTKELFVEVFPPADPAMAARDGTYQAVTFGEAGRRVQVIVLDTRWFRSPLLATDERDAPGKERYLPDPDPSKTMLGEEQWTWLEQQLRQPAQLRILVSSIQVLAEGHGFERWGNLPAERERLVDLIARTGAGGLVIVSGDRHIGMLYRRDGQAPYPLYEVTASSFNRTRGDESRREPGPWMLGIPYAHDNYGAIAIDWSARVLALELRDGQGATVRGVTLALDELVVP